MRPRPLVADGVLASVGDLGGHGVDPVERVEDALGSAGRGVGRGRYPDMALVVLLHGFDADRGPRELAREPLETLRFIGHDELRGVQ